LTCSAWTNPFRLNALTGIDGIWTLVMSRRSNGTTPVLMPLRALMGFGPTPQSGAGTGISGLNALTGIDGIWTDTKDPPSLPTSSGLNALTGIDGIWTPQSQGYGIHLPLQS